MANIRKKKRLKPCPKHGTKYLVREKGGILYCLAPDDKGGKCFYHPGGNTTIKKKDNSKTKPDVLRTLFESWYGHKEQIQRDRLRAKQKYKEEKEELSYI